MTESPSNDQPPNQRFRVQRRRLGIVKSILKDGEFGFIEAEDFRDDVFFHCTVWQEPEGRPQPDRPPRDDRNSGPPRRPINKNLSPELVGVHVEFEIDDDLFFNEKKLRAKVVSKTKRPLGRKLSGRDATFRIVTHHPKARRKRPSWRNKDS